MWFYIDPDSPVPIYIQIKQQIKKAAAGGVFKPGEKLPSVRELARELTVNPNTVSKAYQELENEGVIIKERGIGMFVSAGQTAESKEDRIESVADILEKLFIEAYHLNLTSSELKALFEEYLARWSGKLDDRG
ncbi:HTH-type transcriptional repressor YtrA [Koleobacter methoxysyntrophicus]|jgi:GntR family transcriptional regulator|uniref:HTH-type transcriptional repressor YtrA n=1 Tax=Koleobacter methoxysyntrophicus TaxID=2751313 RepID=A0A8A0RIY7_9FIRM|nr:GntR family transcriptional regulator [Koleobacter methoxysyntrophicus]QSQ08183.1 HTH-type transcriptional repressor YtrA [Koleobacter methoxysyntrophicus]